MQYYQASSITPLTGKGRVRKIHTLVIEIYEHLSKIKWIKSEKAVRASVLVARKEDQNEFKEVIVVVPTKWRFVKRIEELRDSTEEDKLSELVYNWRFWDIPAYAGLEVWNTYTYTPCTCGDEDIYPQGHRAQIHGGGKPTTGGYCFGAAGFEPVDTRMGKASQDS